MASLRLKNGLATASSLLKTLCSPPSKMPRWLSTSNVFSCSIRPLSQEEVHQYSPSSATASKRKRCTHHLLLGNPFVKVGWNGILRLQTEKEVARVRLHLPGVGKEDIKVWLEDGLFKVVGVESKPDGDVFEKEPAREYAFQLKVDYDKAMKKDAMVQIKNGVLTFVIPRSQAQAVEEERPNEIVKDNIVTFNVV